MTLATLRGDAVVSAGVATILETGAASPPAPDSFYPDRRAKPSDMPVIKVNDQHFSLRPGPNRLGGGEGVDVAVADNTGLGVQAIVDVAGDSKAVIRRAGDSAAVRVNGIPLVDPTPLMHGDRLEIGGREAFYTDDAKAGSTQFIVTGDIAGIAAKRAGVARATAPTGGRLVSLVDGKEYSIPEAGITIGRDATSGVVVAQNDVSRKHAELRPVDGGYEIRDYSANGVYVNGTRLETAALLSRSDVIRVGSEEFRFHADVAAPKTLAPTPPLASLAVGSGTPATAAPAFANPAPSAVSAPPAAVAGGDRPVLGSLEIVNEGPSRGMQFDIRVPLAHIGRGAHNDIVVKDESVSDTHAKLQRRDDGWYVCDVGSTNGTYVGGQRIVNERRLEGVPDLRFGGVKMVFRPRDAGQEVHKGTRVVAGFDRTKLRRATPAEPAPQQTAPAPQPQQRAGIPVWVWGLVVLAIAAVVGFFLLNR
jgi:pSer/pThr/pTyr-binding forkhead associated (FHA) protein